MNEIPPSRRFKLTYCQPTSGRVKFNDRRNYARITYMRRIPREYRQAKPRLALSGIIQSPKSGRSVLIPTGVPHGSAVETPRMGV
jgi:hypothetical protein